MSFGKNKQPVLIKTVVVIFLWCGSSIMAVAQVGNVRGKILDATSGQGLPYASVYVNLTTIGTYANDKGEFELSGIPFGTYDLMASYIGHQVVKTKIEVRDAQVITLQIKLQLVAMKAVEITAKRDDSWFKKLDKFKKLFLGHGAPAKLCTIVNPYGLNFVDDKKKGLTATATEPLEVDNLYLGYKILYDLTRFSVSKKDYFVSGYVRFTELQTTDTVLAKRWTKNRRKAYAGSLSHFLNSVEQHQIRESGYDLYEDRSGLKEIVRLARFQSNFGKTIFDYSLEGKVSTSPDSSVFHVNLPTRLEIHYRNGSQPSRIYWDVSYPVSWIEVKGGDLVLNRDAVILNPAQMTLSGQMLEARVAELLPNDYRPKIPKSMYRRNLEVKPGELNYLAEKAYLQTDRSYYYPGEDLWYKAYMIYNSAIERDSLSHVLYVDLVDTNNSVITCKASEINKEFSSGNFALADNIQPGDYTLRAYTRWMLNFDTAFVFKKPVKILALNESVRGTGEYKVPEDAGITIATNKDEYSPRELIELSIETQDEFENLSSADLSVSVTDLNQAWPAKNERSILQEYILPDISLGKPDKNNFLPIQKGFDVSGTFISKQSKKTTGVLTFIQEGVDNRFIITTETNGHFNIPDLLLFDSTKISYFAKAYKGRYGSVVFDSTRRTPTTVPSSPLAVTVYAIPQPKIIYNTNLAMKTTLLNSVTIEDKPIVAAKKFNGIVDYEVTGDWLRDRNSVDILCAMQAKIPGFRILIKIVDDLPVRHIQLSGPSGLTGSSEPLVLMDGIALNDRDIPIADQISNLLPDMIDRIEVTKYGGGAAYGARGGNGVIAIFTRRPGSVPATAVEDYDKSKLKSLKVQGFSRPGQFISPDYSNPERDKDVPDVRTTIYWNPFVTTDAKKPTTISFYAADIPTQYRIVMEGVTHEGRPVRAEKIVSVKKSLAATD